jgi:hypothetical protein
MYYGISLTSSHQGLISKSREAWSIEIFWGKISGKNIPEHALAIPKPLQAT